MDGATRAAGAVLGLKTTRHAVSGARAVMEDSPHVALYGCDAWLEQQGLEQCVPSWFDTEARRKQLEAAKLAASVAQDSSSCPAGRSVVGQRADGRNGSRVGDLGEGTVGAVVLDAHGQIVAASSTGGMTNKWCGRIGDTPCIGAGTYACPAWCASRVNHAGHEYYVANPLNSTLHSLLSCFPFRCASTTLATRTE